MGMSTSVYGFKPPDEKWLEMKKVYDACVEAKIPIPKEVDCFFEGEKPDDSGVRVQLRDTECLRRYSDSDYCAEGFELVIDKLPKDVKIVLFLNSW